MKKVTEMCKRIHLINNECKAAGKGRPDGSKMESSEEIFQFSSQPLKVLSNPGCPPFPVVAFIVAEHQIISVEVMDDTIDTAVALNVLNLRAVMHSLA